MLNARVRPKKTPRSLSFTAHKKGTKTPPNVVTIDSLNPSRQSVLPVSCSVGATKAKTIAAMTSPKMALATAPFENRAV